MKKPFDEMTKTELKDEVQNEILASINNAIVSMEDNSIYSETERKVFISELKKQGNRIANLWDLNLIFSKKMLTGSLSRDMINLRNKNQTPKFRRLLKCSMNSKNGSNVLHQPIRWKHSQKRPSPHFTTGKCRAT